MSAGVIEVGHHLINLRDVRSAFMRAVEWFGGNLPEIPKVWDSGDRYTPVMAALDNWGSLTPIMKLLL
ncbi:MAG: hypothetical protein AAF988_05190 [Pseudomonadota bacterium]